LFSEKLITKPGIGRIAFIGLPGSGKSTIGRQLAVRLNVAFYDSDSVIEKQLGCSIREFFDREGEPAFREIEHTVMDELTQKLDCVVSTGGGVVLDSRNREMLRSRCQTVYLHSQPEEIFRRLRHDRNRPLLQVDDPFAKLQQMYSVRDPLYRESAHLVVETGRPSVFSVISTIIALLEPRD
jgi:shikimate kinase